MTTRELKQRIMAGDEADLVTARDVARVSLLSVKAIRNHISKGALPAHRIGPSQRVVRIRCSDAKTYIYGSGR